ncbi:hypothetical protein [Corynebacterium sphenisci]|uniref:hypothetical protein n=1 Tax=Corynebacterium sphenisci TaxID=191493 RepID=UPI0026DED00B|nr:hypothetical protein [Corynebacterium sphenisci]MDO5731605.1 hypothetical protein [Corynebacterium sphenisci]
MDDRGNAARYQAAVGFDFHPMTAAAMGESFAAAGAPLLPEAVLAVGAGAAPVLRYQDPSGAIASFGPGRARIGFDPGSAPVRAGIARPVDLECSAAWLTLADLATRGEPAPAAPEGEFRMLPVLEDDLRDIDDRRDLGQLRELLDSGRAAEALGRLRFTALFRDDLAVRTAAGNAAAAEPWTPGELPDAPAALTVTGRIVESRRQVNTHTGRTFHQLRLRLAHGVDIDACAPPRAEGRGYPVGGWVRGAVLITGGFRMGPGEPLHFDDRDCIGDLAVAAAPYIGFVDGLGVVEADPADCLGIPLREDPHPVHAICRAAPTARWRLDSYRLGDGVPRTGLSREDEDGVGLAVTFPDAQWGAYVAAADGRPRIAATEVVHVPHPDHGALSGIDVAVFARYAERARADLRGHAAGYARSLAEAVRGGETPPAGGYHHLPPDFAERALADPGAAVAAAPEYHHGMRVPLCLRLGAVRRVPTALTGPGQEWSAAPGEERSRLEAEVELDGSPAVLVFPGSVTGLTPGCLVLGWGTVCSHIPGHPQVVTGGHARAGYPRPRLRPAGDPLDDLDYSAGEILAAAGVAGTAVDAVFATSRSPATASLHLRRIGAALGVAVEVDDRRGYRLSAGEDLVPALPVGFHQLDALRDALAGALVAEAGGADPELRALVDMAEALYGGMPEALAAARRRLRAARDAEQLSLPFDDPAGAGEAAGDGEGDPDWDGDEEDLDRDGDGFWSVDECGGPDPDDPGESGRR